MVNGTHICIHRDGQISREEIDAAVYRPSNTARFVSGNKYNPMYYIYLYGLKWANVCKLESVTIGEDVYILTYHPDNKGGELHRLGPDSMEVVEHNFSVKDFHNLRNHKVYIK